MTEPNKGTRSKNSAKKSSLYLTNVIPPLNVLCYRNRMKGGNSSSFTFSEGDDDGGLSKKQRIWRRILRYSKLVILAVCWLLFTSFSVIYEEHNDTSFMVTVFHNNVTVFDITEQDLGANVIVRLEGPLTQTTFKFENLYSDILKGSNDTYVGLWIKDFDMSTKNWKNATKEWRAQILKTDKLERAPLVRVEKVLDGYSTSSKRRLYFYTNLKEPLSLNVVLDSTDMTRKLGIIMGAVLLLIIYIHLVFELVHHTLAGVVCCTLGVGLLGAVQLKPAFPTIIQWIHFDTLLLYFGFSIVMAVLAETGAQDYLAAIAYELGNGHMWPVLNVVMLFAFIMGMLYNNITLVLFATPICLRICEVMALRPTPMLCCLIIANNIGSTLTPLGAIANTMITRHPILGDNTISLGTYVIHMLPATILAAAQSYLHLRLQFINSDNVRYTQSLEERRLKHLIKVWRKAANTVGDTSLDERDYQETVNTRVKSLRNRLQRLGKMPTPPANYEEKVQLLRENFRIHNKPYATFCAIALTFSMLMSILSNFNVGYLSSGWVAILSALLILSFTCLDADLDNIMSRIDWSTMLFIVSLFILMQTLIRLGLLESVGAALERSISMVDQKYILLTAILSIIWLSAVLTSFVDNVPIADMMMRIIITMTHGKETELPRMPLIWALALGCALGGNGTIMGALSNIACAGAANSHGYSFKFMEYFKVGFLIMIGNVVLASAYLLVAHVALQWQ